MEKLEKNSKKSKINSFSQKLDPLYYINGDNTHSDNTHSDNGSFKHETEINNCQLINFMETLKMIFHTIKEDTVEEFKFSWGTSHKFSNSKTLLDRLIGSDTIIMDKNSNQQLNINNSLKESKRNRLQTTSSLLSPSNFEYIDDSNGNCYLLQMNVPLLNNDDDVEEEEEKKIIIAQ